MRFGIVKRAVALVTAAGALGIAGTALAASPALAAQYNLTSYSGGTAIAAGTSWSATSGTLNFGNSTGSSSYFSCTSSTLSGVTDAIITGGPQAGLSVTAGSFDSGASICTEAGSKLSIAANFNPAWQVTPTAGTTSPFTGTVDDISMTFTCGTKTATFSGNLSTGSEETNVTGTASGGSQFVLADAGSLTKSGTGCAALPSIVYVTGTYKLVTVGGSPVSPTNNLWLNYS